MYKYHTIKKMMNAPRILLVRWMMSVGTEQTAALYSGHTESLWRQLMTAFAYLPQNTGIIRAQITIAQSQSKGSTPWISEIFN